MELIGETLKSLINQSNCYYRITACQSLKNASKALEKNDFNDVFSTICKKIEGEKVPNVILAFLAAYAQVKSQLTPQSKKDFQTTLKKIKELKDQDVLYFAEKVKE